jgi:hypothetical protein
MTGTRLGGGDANLTPALVQDGTGRGEAWRFGRGQRDREPARHDASAKKPPTRACVIPRNLRLQSRAFDGRFHRRRLFMPYCR